LGIHGSSSIDSYNKGYDAGFETALKTKLTSEVSQTNPIKTEIINNNLNSSNMARQTSFSYQLELAEDIKRYLHGFQERLGAIAQNNNNKCNEMHEAGMMDETHRDFVENYMEVTIQTNVIYLSWKST
jgi:hypothetical protein